MRDTEPTRLEISIPSWVEDTVDEYGQALVSDREKMRLAIHLSQLNVERGGGPFAALVFGGEALLGVGVNRVLASGFSIAHAEILALMGAQYRALNRLIGIDHPLTLVTTSEPCCQCFGALIWAGVERLVCGATTADAETIGFDEGPKPESWVNVLERRGIAVLLEVERADAAAVLQSYATQGGTIYGRSG
jgi:tRNA(Arg) A34 adenosine deaminase TadA